MVRLVYLFTVFATAAFAGLVDTCSGRIVAFEREKVNFRKLDDDDDYLTRKPTTRPTNLPTRSPTTSPTANQSATPPQTDDSDLPSKTDGTEDNKKTKTGGSEGAIAAGIFGSLALAVGALFAYKRRGDKLASSIPPSAVANPDGPNVWEEKGSLGAPWPPRKGHGPSVGGMSTLSAGTSSPAPSVIAGQVDSDGFERGVSSYFDPQFAGGILGASSKSQVTRSSQSSFQEVRPPLPDKKNVESLI